MTKIAKGIKWNGISQLITQLTVFGGSIVLGRILSPDEFGTVAMVTIISSFAAKFMDMGFNQALVQKKEVSSNELSSVFWLNSVISIILFLLFFFAAPLISYFYNKAELTVLTRVLSTTFLLGIFPQIPRTILIRQMDFKKIGIVNIISVPTSYALAIIMALFGFGLWSIVGQIIISNVVSAVMFFNFTRWIPMLHCKKDDINTILNFSLSTFFNQFLEYWAQNLSSVLIGKSLGAFEIGIYSRSRVFILLPIRNISSVINNTIFPKLSQHTSDLDTVSAYYHKFARFQAYLIFPAMIGLSSIAEEFIIFFLGEQWQEMTPILKIFAFLSIVASTFAINDTTILSQGKADKLLKLGLFEKTVFIILPFIGLKYGLMGLVYSNAIAYIIVFLPKYWLLHQVIKVSTKKLFKNYRNIAFMSAIMWVGLYLTDISINTLLIWQKLVIKVTLGVVIYTILSLITEEPIFKELLKRVKKRD